MHRTAQPFTTVGEGRWSLSFLWKKRYWWQILDQDRSLKWGSTGSGSWSAVAVNKVLTLLQRPISNQSPKVSRFFFHLYQRSQNDGVDRVLTEEVHLFPVSGSLSIQNKTQHNVCVESLQMGTNLCCTSPALIHSPFMGCLMDFLPHQENFTDSFPRSDVLRRALCSENRLNYITCSV